MNRIDGNLEYFELENCSFHELFPFAQHNFVESIRSEKEKKITSNHELNNRIFYCHLLVEHSYHVISPIAEPDTFRWIPELIWVVWLLEAIDLYNNNKTDNSHSWKKIKFSWKNLIENSWHFHTVFTYLCNKKWISLNKRVNSKNPPAVVTA